MSYDKVVGMLHHHLLPSSLLGASNGFQSRGSFNVRLWSHTHKEGTDGKATGRRRRKDGSVMVKGVR